MGVTRKINAKGLGEKAIRYPMDNANNIEIKKPGLKGGSSWVLRDQIPAQTLSGAADEPVGMAPSAWNLQPACCSGLRHLSTP